MWLVSHVCVLGEVMLTLLQVLPNVAASLNCYGVFTSPIIKTDNLLFKMCSRRGAVSPPPDTLHPFQKGVVYQCLSGLSYRNLSYQSSPRLLPGGALPRHRCLVPDGLPPLVTWLNAYHRQLQ